MGSSASRTSWQWAASRHEDGLATLASLHQQFDDPINIHLTSGTTGAPKGATLHLIHNILNNGFFIGEAQRLERARPRLHSGAALSLLRHGARQSRLRHAWGGDDPILPRVSSRWPRGDCGSGERCTALYGVPHHVHRRARPSGFPKALASTSPRCAPGSWRGLALPHRGNAALRERDAHV